MSKVSLLMAVALAAGSVTAFAGNDAPAGPHFNLNIIGKDDCNGPQKGGGGNVIQIPLWGPSKILLSQGDFAVVDANGCDGSAAFQLPAQSCDALPTDYDCWDNDTSAEEYYVFARSLGKPNGKITITTCATAPGDDGIFDTGDDEEVCSTESMVSVRTTGKGATKFANVTKYLTSIVADVDGDGTTERVALFDESLQDYFWSLDNQGNRLLQLRFYRAQDVNKW